MTTHECQALTPLLCAELIGRSSLVIAGGAICLGLCDLDIKIAFIAAKKFRLVWMAAILTASVITSGVIAFTSRSSNKS